MNRKLRRFCQVSLWQRLLKFSRMKRSGRCNMSRRKLRRSGEVKFGKPEKDLNAGRKTEGSRLQLSPCAA